MQGPVMPRSAIANYRRPLGRLPGQNLGLASPHHCQTSPLPSCCPCRLAPPRNSHAGAPRMPRPRRDLGESRACIRAHLCRCSGAHTPVLTRTPAERPSLWATHRPECSHAFTCHSPPGQKACLGPDRTRASSRTPTKSLALGLCPPPRCALDHAEVPTCTFPPPWPRRGHEPRTAHVAFQLHPSLVLVPQRRACVASPS